MSISENGKNWIRSGGVAIAVISAVRRSGGNLVCDDFESHKSNEVNFQKPIVVTDG